MHGLVSSWSPFLPRHSLVMKMSRPTPQAVPAPKPSPSRARLIFAGDFTPPDLELLERMISAMGVKREDAHLCSTQEVNETVAALRPEFVVILAMPETLHKTRGEWEGDSVKTLTTWHPAHLRSLPSAKKEAWQDLQKVARALGTLA